MADTNLIQQSWSQAQAGDAGAITLDGRSLMTIAQLLTTTLNDPQIKVEVSRRDRTLYVFLTAPDALAQSHVPIICAVITALGLADITQLKVLNGTEKRLLNRWQHDITLEPAQPDLAASSQSPEAALGGAQLPAEAATPRLLSPQGGDRPPAPDRRWRWGMLTAAAALGFGLTAAVTQWRYSQPPAPPLRRPLPLPSLIATPLGLPP